MKFAYPEHRNLNPEAIKQIYEHLAFKVKITDIIRFVEENHGIKLTDYDVANYRRNWKKQLSGGLSEEELLSSLIKSIIAEDQGAKCDIITSESGVAEIIFLQTSKMRPLLKMYPIVLFIDSTYKTNDRHVPLFSIKVVDRIKQSSG